MKSDHRQMLPPLEGQFYGTIPGDRSGSMGLTTQGQGMLSSFIRALRDRARKSPKLFGLVDDARSNAKAFSRLQSDLFRFPWVEGVATQGFARPSGQHNPPKESSVYIITSAIPDTETQQAALKIVVGANNAFGTRFKAVVIDRKSFSPAFTGPVRP